MARWRRARRSALASARRATCAGDASAMMAAIAGTTSAAFLGCLAGQWEIVLVIVAGAAAATCAVLALYDEDLWWVSLQMVIALLVAGHYSGPIPVAATRAGAVFAGGAAQLLIVVVLATLAPSAAGRLPPSASKPPPERKLTISHAIRAAVCVDLSWPWRHAWRSAYRQHATGRR